MGGSRTVVAPTRNPSTAGARWLFAEKEFIRRTGDTKANRTRFRIVLSRLESMSEADLRKRMVELEIVRQGAVSAADADKAHGEIVVIQCELGRRAVGQKEQRQKKHDDLLREQAEGSAKAARRTEALNEGDLARRTVKLLAATLGLETVSAAIELAAKRLPYPEEYKRELVGRLLVGCQWAVANEATAQPGPSADGETSARHPELPHDLRALERREAAAGKVER